MNKTLLILALVVIAAGGAGYLAVERDAVPAFLAPYVERLPGVGHDHGDETALEHAARHADPKFVCPMHPQIIRDEPGSCPICGMDLVEKEVEPAPETALEHALKHADPNYVCPMHPQIVRDEPGSCPICGMDLVPVEVEDGGGEEPVVSISPRVEQHMGVRTAEAERGRLWRRIDTVGYVDLDETRISHIHLRTEGWLDRLTVKSEGERVARGDLLFQVYAPELVNAQEEYLQALATGDDALISASRERLLALGITNPQVRRIAETRRALQLSQVYAPQDGVVAALNVREGMYVKPTTEVMTLADLSRVWLVAEVFEAQADWVKVGQPAEVRLPYRPGRVWEGEVEYIYPKLDPRTRTLKVRLAFDNPEEDLKPNMFADVTLYAGPKDDVLHIPREALIRSGKAERVILALGDGRFQAREVTAGLETGDWVEILAGLEAGERVVTSGQFLIDSESSLKASLARMGAGG
jgi:Cu(I)/Ag(I) efflux system membrane fusion protein